MRNLALVVTLGLAACGAPRVARHDLVVCGRDAAGLSCSAWRDGRFTPPAGWSGAFSDTADWAASPSYWATLQSPDLDGDGRSDVCGRAAGGLTCARRDRSGNGFDAAVRSPVFGDSAGFDDWSAAATLQFADVDGDGHADACARNGDGVWCAFGRGDGSFDGALLVDDGFFSDAHDFGGAGYGGTLQLGDLEGDGRADLCVRGAGGVWCARALDRTFSDPTLWSDDFADVEGWGTPAAAASLDLVDADGDGRADLCGLGPRGLQCARSLGDSFAAATRWSSDFVLPAADPAAPVFGDIDGDGRADVCALVGGVVRCALSTGDAFAPARRWDTALPAGWLATRARGVFGLVDLDGDGRADACVQQPGAVTCARSLGTSFSAASAIPLDGLAALVPFAARHHVAPALNPTADENQRHGTRNWWVPMPQQARAHEVEAYTGALSYQAGETITVYASTGADGDAVEWRLLRTGWYGGVGARELVRGGWIGQSRPLPPAGTTTQPARCDWPASFLVPLPADAVSGVYLLRLDNLRANKSYLTTLVVRDDARAADLVVERADFTDAAYNNWDGGDNVSSSYLGRPIVSFDRPLRTPYSAGFDFSWSAGYFTYEYSMVRWLERQGYDVKYVSDFDVHARPLSGARAFLSVGHDEYWTDDQRDHVEAARNAGLHAGFFGADAVDGAITLLDARTFSTILPQTVSSKRSFDRNPIDLSKPPHDNPSDTLTGTHLVGWCGNVHPACLRTGDGQPWARLSEPDTFDLGARHPALRNLRPLGASRVLPSVVGYEYEVLGDPALLPWTTAVLARATTIAPHGFLPVMVAYQRAGARVFNAGSILWAHALDGWAGRAAFRSSDGERPCRPGEPDCFVHVSPAAQQITANVLADFGARAATPTGVIVDDGCDWLLPSAACNARRSW